MDKINDFDLVLIVYENVEDPFLHDIVSACDSLPLAKSYINSLNRTNYSKSFRYSLRFIKFHSHATLRKRIKFLDFMYSKNDLPF